jgi:hypothetical protein
MEKKHRVPWSIAYGFSEFTLDSETDGEFTDAVAAQLASEALVMEQAAVAILGGDLVTEALRHGATIITPPQAATAQSPAMPMPATSTASPAAAPAYTAPAQTAEACPDCGAPGRVVQKGWGPALDCTNPNPHGKDDGKGKRWPYKIRNL